LEKERGGAKKGASRLAAGRSGVSSQTKKEGPPVMEVKGDRIGSHHKEKRQRKKGGVRDENNRRNAFRHKGTPGLTKMKKPEKPITSGLVWGSLKQGYKLLRI